MYEHWYKTWCAAVEWDEVYPSEDLLDEMHANNAVQRAQITKALIDFMESFNELMIANQVAQVVLTAGFGSIRLKDRYASIHTTPVTI